MTLPSLTLPIEYDLTGQTAIIASAGGAETPLLAAALAEAGAQIFRRRPPSRCHRRHP